MRGRRSKAYKKLMGAFHQTFGFREPYQVLVDTEMIKEAARCAMELAPALERTLRGKAKPMITQCSIRHLYLLPPAEHANRERLIGAAKSFERRKCNHHELESPLSEKECFESVVLGSGRNKHHYVVAFQSREIRSLFRDVPGVPSIVISRSVMLLEPMNDASKRQRDAMERGKLVQGAMDARAAEKALTKRKREDEGEEDGADGDGGTKEEMKKKKKKRGPKGPNPLSVKKKAAPKPAAVAEKPAAKETGQERTTDGQVRKKRKRKHGKAVPPAAPAPVAVSAADD